MQKRFLPALLLAASLLIIIGFGCTKLDTTTLGSDLVAVDNINTFADTLSVNTTQGFFINDSTILGKKENHIIGNIGYDPLFGSTESAIYVQFKPTFYPFFFGNAGDTVKNNINAGLDSAFVCLSYRGAYGDSSAMAVAQTFEIKQIADEDFRIKTDTLRRLNYRPELSIPAPTLGYVTITPQIIKKKIVFANRRDSVDNQIRIKFNTPAGIAFINSFYNNQDSSFTVANNAFSRDSAFRKMLHGFAITSAGLVGNTLYYVNLDDAKSRLEFHFRKTKNGVKDTAVQSFQMYSSRFGNTAASSSANFIQRNYSGSAAASPPTSDIFLQTAPGTFANINIPGLTGYGNRIVHRAFLVAEQTPFNSSDNIFTAPPYLYLDLKDTVTSLPQRYKPLYFDLNANVSYDPDALTSSSLFHPFPAANVDLNNFGGVARDRFDPSGVKFTRYEINLTRYVQHIVTNGYRNYDLRLYAPFNYIYPQYSGTKFLIPFYNPIAFGRVRVGSGTGIAHRMKLIVIYSKI